MTESFESLPPAAAGWGDILANLPPTDTNVLLSRLTPTERVVALQVGRGLSNREIAIVLGKAEATVKRQVGSCLRKLGAKNRLRLIALLK